MDPERWLEELLQDVRYTQRTLRRNLSLALAVVATLALGIGSSTAVFSIVDGVLLRPLPYPRPERIVQFWEVNPRDHRMSVADANFQDLAARAHGIVIAIAGVRALAGFLYGVSPLDPLAFLVVVALLATTGAIASWASARRAAAVSPVEVLRA